MNGINLARTITTKRRERQLTQDELASFFGVTKASVSKWETGQSYPDITLLPQLAAFFNVSIDELMGYEPQMIESDIRKLYKELSLEFTQKSVDEVLARCRDIVKKYYSCFPLLFQIGVLYINYGYYTVKNIDEAQKAAIVAEAKEYFLRVRECADDAELRHATLHMLAICELLLGNPDEVIRMFENIQTYSPTSNEMLVSQAYMMTGKAQEAKSTLQNSVYERVMELLVIIPSYMNICIDDAAHFDEICKRTLTTMDTWNADKLAPIPMLPFYLTAATGYLANEDATRALDMLEMYTDVATSDIFPIAYTRDNFFDLIKIITDDDLPFGTAEAPRDEKTIKESIVDAVVTNPVFALLHENPRFKSISSKLQHALA